MELEYLLNKINGRTSPSVNDAEQAYLTAVDKLLPLIQQLTWKDFELLTDLIFRQGGVEKAQRAGQDAENPRFGPIDAFDERKSVGPDKVGRGP